MYVKSIKIGDVELKNNILLAPMAGITDRPFRLICEKFEPGLVFTEMVSAKALCYGDEKTKKLLNTKGESGKIAVQIFGSDVESMINSGKLVSKTFPIVDINMGCPAPKVVKNGDGSKLLLNIDLIYDIVKNVVENVDVPVTVKLRKGWDLEHVVAVDAAQAIETAGAKMITIHGRTRSEFYSGKADLNIIKKVKESVSIPVIGNGDIIDEEAALRMFEQTGVDGIMIARGSLGNPWIFKKIKYFLETGEKLPAIGYNEKLKIMLEHIENEVQEKGEIAGIREMRKHIAWYIKGMKDATKIRIAVNKIDNKNELEELLKNYIQKEHTL